MLQIIPSAIVAPEADWCKPRHLVVLNRGSTTQRVAVLTRTGRFSIGIADDSEAVTYSSPCEHIVFEVLANAHRKLLLHLHKNTRSADDRLSGLIPAVCLGAPDRSVIAVASLECSNRCDAQMPWSSPAAQLLHKYQVSEERIIQLLRQGSNAAAPRSPMDDGDPGAEAPLPTSCHSELQCAGQEREVQDVSMEERTRGMSQFSTTICKDQLAVPPVFQAVQIEIEGRTAVVKKVMQVHPNSRASSRTSSMPHCSRTSSRGSASSMAMSAASSGTTVSFNIGGKWYDARGNVITPQEDEWMEKVSASVNGTNSMCGQRVSSGSHQSMSGEAAPHQAPQNEMDHLKSAALAAASAALGLSELPDPVSFKSPSCLPLPGSEASVPAKSQPKTEIQANSRVTEVDQSKTRSKGGVTRDNMKKKISPGMPTLSPAQLTQSQIDANWDALV